MSTLDNPASPVSVPVVSNGSVTFPTPPSSPAPSVHPALTGPMVNGSVGRFVEAPAGAGVGYVSR